MKGWVKVDKQFIYALPTERPYTPLEAFFSFAVDVSEGQEYTLSGYAKLWGWSRTKVQGFITGLKTGSEQSFFKDRAGRRQAVCSYFGNLAEGNYKESTIVEQVTSKEPTPKKAPKVKPEKVKYAEFVHLLPAEYDKLVAEHTEPKVARMIEVLNNYKGSKGKKYASDYMAILNWVVGRVNEEWTRTPPPTAPKGWTYGY
jgi:hypothetical protein